MNTWIYLGSIIVAGILFALIPENKLRKYLSIFSFKKFGIRKKKRWNALIDDLGNGFQVLSLPFPILNISTRFGSCLRFCALFRAPA